NERDDKKRLDEEENNTYKFNEENENNAHTPPEQRDVYSLDNKDSSESRELDMSVKADLPHGAVGHGALDMKNLPRSKPGWKIIFEELISDKLALFSLIILVIITAYVFGLTMFLNQAAIVKVDLFSINQPPNDEFRLGTDYGGRDIFGQLIIGTRNSLAIGFLVTALSVGFGIVYGVVSGYFGGHIDNAMMRCVGFFMGVSFLFFSFLIIIVVSVIIFPSYDIYTFSLIMAAFLWTGTARLIRSIAMQEKELDYINASRTLGSSNIKIIFTQLMPNMVGLIIVNA